MDIKSECLKEVRQHEEYLDSNCKTGYSIEIIGIDLSGIDLSNRHLSIFVERDV